MKRLLLQSLSFFIFILIFSIVFVFVFVLFFYCFSGLRSSLDRVALGLASKIDHRACLGRRRHLKARTNNRFDTAATRVAYGAHLHGLCECRLQATATLCPVDRNSKSLERSRSLWPPKPSAADYREIPTN
jgi:hypothetical protein